MKRCAFLLVCLLPLLLPLTAFGDDAPATAGAPAVTAPQPQAPDAQALPGDAGMSPLPDLTPAPSYKLKACDFYHFSTGCIDCLNFCEQIPNCYGTCSWPNGHPWCDCAESAA